MIIQTVTYICDVCRCVIGETKVVDAGTEVEDRDGWNYPDCTDEMPPGSEPHCCRTCLVEHFGVDELESLLR